MYNVRSPMALPGTDCRSPGAYICTEGSLCIGVELFDRLPKNTNVKPHLNAHCRRFTKDCGRYTRATLSRSFNLRAIGRYRAQHASVFRLHRHSGRSSHHPRSWSRTTRKPSCQANRGCLSCASYSPEHIGRTRASSSKSSAGRRSTSDCRSGNDDDRSTR